MLLWVQNLGFAGSEQSAPAGGAANQRMLLLSYVGRLVIWGTLLLPPWGTRLL
jgi:hypothetical protein